jgi:protein farnesyltransferase subunit beta
LCIINTEESLNIIDREKLKHFLISLKDPKSKGFRMHKDGEVDVRGAYTALAVAHLVNIVDDQVTEGVAEYILNCQTYEVNIFKIMLTFFRVALDHFLVMKHMEDMLFVD